MTITPPSFVAEYESSWITSTTPRTVTPTVAPGDGLVIAAMTVDSSVVLSTPPTDNLGTPLTYTLQQTIQVTDYCMVRIWTAPVPTQSGSFTLSLAKTGATLDWGLNCVRFSGVNSFGASAKNNADAASGGSSVSLTTQAAQSVVVAFAADWGANDAARTARTVNGNAPSVANTFEKTYFNLAGQYTVYGAYWPDAGNAGANTYGWSAPAVQKYAIAAVEVKGNTFVPPPAGFGSGFFDGI